MRIWIILLFFFNFFNFNFIGVSIFLVLDIFDTLNTVHWLFTIFQLTCSYFLFNFLPLFNFLCNFIVYCLLQIRLNWKFEVNLASWIFCAVDVKCVKSALMLALLDILGHIKLQFADLVLCLCINQLNVKEFGLEFPLRLDCQRSVLHHKELFNERFVSCWVKNSLELVICV